MSFTSKGTQEILAAGLQDQMLVIDLAKGEIVKKVHLPPFLQRTTGFKERQLLTTVICRFPRNISIRS
jgi:hypothetical protein